MVKKIQRQLPNESEKVLMENTASALSAGSTGIVTANIALNLLMSASLQYLWDMINAQ